MAFSPAAGLRAAYYRYRWRRRRKAGRSIRVRVSDPVSFLQQLEEAGVRTAVMRWWDEVPTTPEAAAAMPGDVDVLVDDRAADAAACIAASMPGGATLEFRSVKGRFGALASQPYFPPAISAEVLAARVPHERGFMIPSPQHRLPLVLFHLCYHKRERSGIPTGVGIPAASAKCDYAVKLHTLAEECGAELPRPLTLRAIHDELRGFGWDMQLDALERWPLQSRWIEHLAAHSRGRYQELAERLPEVLVFLLRSDLDDHLRGTVREQLGKWFDVIEEGEIDREQRRRCVHHLRGGNWLGDRGTRAFPPTHYVICNDPSPVPVTDPHLRATQPHITNARVRLKRVLRNAVRATAERDGGRCRHGIHSSDNCFESVHFLEVLFGAQLHAKVAELARSVALDSRPSDPATPAVPADAALRR